MVKKILTLIIFVFVTSSCSIYRISSVNTNDTYYPQKSIDDVVYLENVNQPHEIIGVITITAERQQRSMNEIIDKMKYEAAIFGGNAITDIKSDATGIWKRLPAQQAIGNAYVRARFTASIIVLK